jgi:hypothetical protein
VFYLTQAMAIWVVSIWTIQWQRLRKLFVFGVLGGYTALLQDRLGAMSGLWEYKDSRLLGNHGAISVVISLSAAPLFAIYFAQGLKAGEPLPWRRILLITATAMVPEIFAYYTGHLAYGKWWGFGPSVAAYFVLWTIFWAIHRWLFSCGGRRRGQPSGPGDPPARH